MTSVITTTRQAITYAEDLRAWLREPEVLAALGLAWHEVGYGVVHNAAGKPRVLFRPSRSILRVLGEA